MEKQQAQLLEIKQHFEDQSGKLARLWHEKSISTETLQEQMDILVKICNDRKQRILNQ